MLVCQVAGVVVLVVFWAHFHCLTYIKNVQVRIYLKRKRSTLNINQNLTRNIYHVVGVIYTYILAEM